MIGVSTFLLTPRMQGLLERIQRAHRPPLHSLSVEQARLLYNAGAEILDLPRAPLARVEDLFIPVSPDWVCQARIYAINRDPLPILLYLHGGGFTVGNLETHDSLCRQLALRSGVAVIALDYRLAPEHRFPTAVNDSFAALQWLTRQHPEDLGLDTQRLAVGGDSAGATLAAVCALLARDYALPLKLQLLITPGTAAQATTASHRLFGRGFLLDEPLLEWFFANYASSHERHDWRFAPLLAQEMDKVAPAWLGLAECDPLVDEGLAYADRLRAAGVSVDLELWRGVTHDFIKMGRAIPEAELAQAAATQALRRALIPESSSAS